MAGTYAAQIAQANPGCILFLLDQSGSMVEPLAGDTSTSKAVVAADTINKLLMNTVLSCTKNADEGPRNYFDVGVIGYGAHRGVGPNFGGALAGRVLVSIKDLAANPLRIEERMRKVPDGAGGLIAAPIKLPLWFEPVAENGTPMQEAVQLATANLAKWVKRHRGSYPPIVVNITDGMPNQNTDPVAAARALRTLATDDGDVLLYNVHLSTLASHPIQFPDDTVALPDDYARMLFEMSSVLPQQIQQELKMEGYAVAPTSRGFIFNSDPVGFIQFLDIGTRRFMMGSAGDR